MFIKSIRWRLQLWLAFLLACILTGFGVTAYQLQRLNRLHQIDEELDRAVAALAGDVRGRPPFLGPPPAGLPPGPRPFDSGPDFPPRRRSGPEGRLPRGAPDGWLDTREIRLSPPTAALFDNAGTHGLYFVVWSRAGAVLKRSTNAPPDLPLPDSPGVMAATGVRLRQAHREAYQFTEIGECILTGRNIGVDLAAVRRFAWWLVCAGGAVLALGLGGGWLLVSHAIRPVQDIGAAASRIAAGQLAERIDLADTDSELGRLAGVLNSTFARLEAAFAQQRQFTADASHELRTPIAVIIAEAQTTLARARSATEYRETVEACLAAAQQMRRLTGSLLELARFDAGQARLECARFDLAERVQACLDLIRPLALERQLRIASDLVPVELVGDSDRLSQAVLNLLNNAIQYNRAQGEIRVNTRAHDDAVLLTVADTGIGIAPGDLPHIFDRFYRADPSRARAEGHCGLGLAISKAIVEAHGGSLEVASQPGAGTTFTVRLPRNAR